MRHKFKAIDLVYIAIGAAITAICSWISIPTAVPFTMQTFAVFAILGILGGRRGTLSILVYIILGAVGVPVFSGFRGGFGVIIGPTGGYIVGFLLTGLIYWLLEKIAGQKLWVRVAAMAAGLLLCYAFGTAWYVAVYSSNTGPISVGTAITTCVLPFIIPDIVKMALALLISLKVAKHIK